MIVVIADDLSGAAELAGAALNRGLSAEVQTVFTPATDAGVICVDTDTRSLPPAEAARVVGEVAHAVAAAKPGWIFKKCDSVLRGNVLAEIRAIMAATGMMRAVLVSANPSRGRVIRGGEYLINDQPVHETMFANDPEHPRRTSRVAALLGGDRSGVQAPDAASVDDLDRHAANLDGASLAAGGVEFFEAILRARKVGCSTGAVPSAGPALRAQPVLFVCGSASAWASGRSQQCIARGIPLAPMPEKLFHEGDAALIDDWTRTIASALKQRGAVMAAIAQARLNASGPTRRLVTHLAAAVVRALETVPAGRVCAEGGATAAALARASGWTRFAVTAQLAGGVVELHPLPAGAPVFVIKVGSYDWPEAAWPSAAS